MANESMALATIGEQFNDRQIDIIRNQIAKGASPDELNLFLEVCKLTGLNPFMKQIYAIKRGGGMTIQTGIDGYRLVAARTGQLAGIDDPQYDVEDAQNPGKATVTVWRFLHGQRVPFTATARWNEYSQTSGLWPKMPYLMLGKCAEALALRKAFPAELSGVYTGEEMQQADNDLGPIVDAEPMHHEQTTQATTQATTQQQRNTQQRNTQQRGTAQTPPKSDSWADLKARAGALGIKDWPAHLAGMTGKTDPKSYTDEDRAKVAKDMRVREQINKRATSEPRATVTEEATGFPEGDVTEDYDLHDLDGGKVKVS